MSKNVILGEDVKSYSMVKSIYSSPSGFTPRLGMASQRENICQQRARRLGGKLNPSLQSPSDAQV